MKRRLWFGVLILLAATCGLVVALDYHLKHAGPVHGYGFPNPSWLIAAAYGDRFESPARPEGSLTPVLHHGMGLVNWNLERYADVKVPPGQWGRWFGPQLLATGIGGEHVLCLRPGLFGRLVLFWNGFRTDRIRAHQSKAVVLRDGFLLVGSSRSALETARPGVGPARLAANRVFLSLAAPYKTEVTLDAREPYRASGQTLMPLSERETPLTACDAWPETPALAVTVSRPEDLASLARYLGSLGQATLAGQAMMPLVKTVATRWGLESPARYVGRDTDEITLALLNPTGGEDPPALAILMRETAPVRPPHPLLQCPILEEARPHEWNKTAGWLAPVLGNAVTCCVSYWDQDWLITTAEPAMARLAGRTTAHTTIDADAVIDVSGPLLAKQLSWGAQAMFSGQLASPTGPGNDTTIHAALAEMGILRLVIRSGKTTTFEILARPKSARSEQKGKRNHESTLSLVR